MNFDSVIFAGGGARCFWQAGFWQAVRSALPQPSVVAAVSGGAALAAVLFAGGWRRFFPRFLQLARASGGNAELRNLLRRRPMFPHARIARDSFLHAVTAEALGRLHAGPDFRMVIAHPPRFVGARLGAIAAFAACELESRLTGRLQPRWTRRLGFRTSVARARDCATPEELVGAVFSSSAAPPMFPVARRRGRLALDGGLVENVPLSAVADCTRPLVLLPGRPRQEPNDGYPVYACPSEPIPVATWDFSSPERVMAAFRLGQRDGRRFLQRTTA